MALNPNPKLFLIEDFWGLNTYTRLFCKPIGDYHGRLRKLGWGRAWLLVSRSIITHAITGQYERWLVRGRDVETCLRHCTYIMTVARRCSTGLHTRGSILRPVDEYIIERFCSKVAQYKHLIFFMCKRFVTTMSIY